MIDDAPERAVGGEKRAVGDEKLFVLRMWMDRQGRWRISLKDLGSKRARYFESLATLVGFLRSVVER